MNARYLLINTFLTLFFNAGLFAQPFQQVTKTTGLPQLSNSRFAFGDMDNDNDLDVIMTGTNTTGNYISGVYRNNGDTTFTPIGALFTPPVINGDIAIGDYNEDNYLDFILSGVSSSGKKYTWLCRNNKNNTFTYINTSFDSVAYGTIKWNDFDLDGDLDVFLSGQNNQNTRVANIYLNNGSGGFLLQPYKGLPGFSNGSAVLCDFNNDFKTDVAISGFDNNNNVLTSIYYYSDNGNYEAQPFLLPQLYNSNMVVEDFDSDGYKDLLLNGTDENLVRYTEVFRNTAGISFTSLSSGLKKIKNGSLAFGDYDNDGKTDVLISGFDNNTLTGVTTNLYKNISGTSLNLTSTILKEVQFSQASFFDFDNDNDMDILVSGNAPAEPVTWLYRNLSSQPNNSPSPPTHIVTEILVDSIRFSFPFASDVETSSMALTYNVWISSKKDSFNLLSPMADLATGYWRNPIPGFFSGTTTGWIKGVKEGKYYWRIQTIDNGYKGSVFSPLDSFVVCKPISIGKDTSVCFGKSIALSVGEGSDVVNWFTKKSGLAPVLSNAFNYNHPSFVTDTIWAELTNELNCQLYDTVLVAAIPLPVSILNDSLKLCTGTVFSLYQGNVSDTVRWHTKEGLITTSLTLSGIVSKNDTIRTTTTSKYGCVSSDTLSVRAYPLPEFSLGNDTSVCKNLGIRFQLPQPYIFSWSVNGIAFNQSVNGISLNGLKRKSNIKALAINSYSCSYSDSIEVNISSLPAADAGSDTIICYGAVVKIGAETTATDGTPPYAYSWYANDSLSFDLADGSVHSDARVYVRRFTNKSYYLNVTDLNGCQDSDTVLVKVNPKPLIDQGLDKVICLGDQVQTGGNPTAGNSLFPFTYLWLPVHSTEANPIVSPNTSTTYTLIAQTRNCKPDSAFIKVTVNPLPFPSTIPLRDTAIGISETLVVKAFGGEKYDWEPSFGLDNAHIQSPMVKVDENVSYYVTVTDSNQCKARDTIHIIVTNRIFIPKMFSPNGDGQNDAFKIYGTGLEQLELRIFDRAGMLVYLNNMVSDILDKGWDGTSDGKALLAGAYQWMIAGKTSSGEEVQFNGKKSGTVFLVK